MRGNHLKQFVQGHTLSKPQNYDANTGSGPYLFQWVNAANSWERNTHETHTPCQNKEASPELEVSVIWVKWKDSFMNPNEVMCQTFRVPLGNGQTVTQICLLQEVPGICWHFHESSILG